MSYRSFHDSKSSDGAIARFDIGLGATVFFEAGHHEVTGFEGDALVLDHGRYVVSPRRVLLYTDEPISL
jgi:hypothetical protein